MNDNVWQRVVVVVEGVLMEKKLREEEAALYWIQVAE